MNPTPNIQLFLGRFHPLLVHLPIGLLVLLVALEFLARTRRFCGANASANYVLALLVPSALVSAACGWMLAGSGDYNAAALSIHRWLGTATASLCALTALLRWAQWKRAYASCLCLSFAVLSAASHFGGSLTHGSDYLVRYAPRSIQALVGGQSATANPPLPRPENGTFGTLIHPVLQARCATCHNPEKHKGGLNMDTYESLMHGGKDGPVIIPGNPAASPLIQRMLLSPDNDDHMPPSGKPQPLLEEFAQLHWWIATGAARDAVTNGVNSPAEPRQTR